MKIRSGFVSNSSSSSFVIKLSDLTPEQIHLIETHGDHAQDMDLEYNDYAWTISTIPDTIRGSTPMNNFDMHEYLRLIEVPDHVITWES